MNASRRKFLAGFGAATAASVAGSAHAQNFIDDILSSNRRGNWGDQFDARSNVSTSPTSTQPVLSAQTIGATERAIEHYSYLASNGGWPSVPGGNRLQIGVAAPEVEVLRQRLVISGDLSERAGVSQSFDTYVDGALKRFQARHGLPQDGVVGPHTSAALNVGADIRLGQLRTNLARLKERGDRSSGRYVLVNIPGAQIEAAENGRVVSRHTAVVGMIDRQTPELESRIHEIIVNPYWNAPESIVRRDIIPHVRENPNYLEESAIRILGPDGQEVDPMTIDWSTEEAARLRFRQDPGRINAMASVKIDFHNPYAVYMHDTPEQSLFGDIERFHSSGCVRVQNVRDLVTWLIRDTPDWDRRRFEQTIQNDNNVPVRLADPVPVHFAYISAWSTGENVVHFRDDIYAKDGAAELQISTL